MARPSETMTKQLSPVIQQQGALIDMIERVMQMPDVNTGALQQILDMNERVFDKNAEIEFNRAMSLAQSDMQPIHKDAENDHTKSTYAKIETICEKITPIYTEHGFALSFSEEDCPKENHIRVVCEITHCDGFAKVKHMDVPIDVTGTSGNRTKTDTHGFGSTISYGRRYITINIFNLTIKDEDNDGNNQVGDCLSALQIDSIQAELEAACLTEDYICKKAGVGTLSQIRAQRFEGCVNHIRAKAEQLKGDNNETV